MGFWDKMLPHLFAQDWYIGVWAIVTIVLMIWTLRQIKDLGELLQKNQSAADPQMLRKLHKRLSVSYSLFTTFISIFPLWGMFGTVSALLRLDMSGELSQIQGHFFEALTSTAWGILFAIAFKVLNAALVSFKAEDLLEKCANRLERRSAHKQKVSV